MSWHPKNYFPLRLQQRPSKNSAATFVIPFATRPIFARAPWIHRPPRSSVPWPSWCQRCLGIRICNRSRWQRRKWCIKQSFDQLWTAPEKKSQQLCKVGKQFLSFLWNIYENWDLGGVSVGQQFSGFGLKIKLTSFNPSSPLSIK